MHRAIYDGAAYDVLDVGDKDVVLLWHTGGWSVIDLADPLLTLYPTNDDFANIKRVVKYAARHQGDPPETQVNPRAIR